MPPAGPTVRTALGPLSRALGAAPDGASLVAAGRPRAVALGVPDTEAFWAALAASLDANTPLFAGHLATDGGTPAELPPEGRALARTAVHAGVAHEDLLQVIRVMHGPIWQRVVDEATRLPPDASAELQRFTMAYQDWFAAALAAVYRDEREAGGDHRLALVGAVLGGGEVDAARLGYDLDLDHVAVVAAGPDARAAIGALAEHLGRHALIVGPEPGIAWGWLGGRRALTEEQLRRLPVGAGTRLGVGDAASGADGFRRSHREAAAAHAHAHAAPAGGVVRYRDVALVDLLLRDPDAAAAIVARELGPLGGGERGERLRETLRAVFATGNGASAAPQLGVSARTVTHRIAEAEQLLGAPLHERRAELELALRVEAALARPARGSGPPGDTAR